MKRPNRFMYTANDSESEVAGSEGGGGRSRRVVSAI
jgi:hypothetical protein